MHAKILITEGPLKGKELFIHKDGLKIGRSMGNDLILSDDMTSRNHATITVSRTGNFFLEDKESKNGVFLNGKRISGSDIFDGDKIQIGKNIFIFKILEYAQEKTPAVLNAEKAKFPESGASLEEISEQIQDYSEVENIEQPSEEPTNVAFKSDIIEYPPMSESINLKIKALYQASKAISNAFNELSLLNVVKNIILQSMNLENGGIFLFDNTQKEFRPQLACTLAPGKIEIAGNVLNIIKEKLSCGINSFLLSPGKLVGTKSENSSIIVSAIRSLEKVYGFIYICSNKETYIHNRDDLDTVTAITDQLAAGLVKIGLQKKNRELTRILSSLEKHLSPEIASAISKKDRELMENPFEAEEREVTVLFSDIENFTALSEKLSPSEIASLLNEYFSRMVEEIICLGGTVNKYIGDAIMAIFGAPQSHENDVKHSVLAALKMVNALKKFHSQVDLKKRFNIRIGINTGNAVAGVIGSEKKMEYTVLGDTVNCASRIESLAPPNGIAIGEQTYETVKNEFICDPIGKINVKGKSQPLRVYVVKGIRGGSHL